MLVIFKGRGSDGCIRGIGTLPDAPSTWAWSPGLARGTQRILHWIELPLSRKSVELIAARINSLHASVKHEYMHHLSLNPSEVMSKCCAVWFSGLCRIWI